MTGDASPAVDFWYEFASPYSYVAAAVIEPRAAAAGVDLRWRPFLLGPIFARQGWRDSPFNVYPAKGRYMWRDMARRCAALGLPFALAAFRANFAEGRDIGERATMAAIIASLERDPEAVLARAEADDIKAALRGATERAMALGIFGAPTLVVGDELFWGGDRIEDALDCARGA